MLLIIADDLGAESTSFYPKLVGATGAVPTPNLAALAAQGIVFENAWASPACSPTRGTIVTGRYAHQNGVTTVGATLPTSNVTLFERLNADSPSYEHAVFGKYHLAGGNSSNLDPRAGVDYPQAPGILQHIRDIGIRNFRGFKPVLSDATATNGRTHSYSEIGANAQPRIWTIRDSRYKLLYMSRHFELYDLVADPLETTNLYASAPHAAARATLEAEIATLKGQAPSGAFFP